MPNHVKNRIEIVGSKDQVAEVLKKFNVHYNAKLSRSHDGGIICKDADADSSYGWFYEKTGVFKRRDFADIIGLPENWEMQIEKAFDHFPDFEKVIPQPENIFRGDLGREEEEMCKREGRPTWRDWNIENWGTKWNSYSCKKESENVFTFETAWSGVPNLIKLMSDKFPKVKLIYEYSDENTGCNCGSGIYENGATTFKKLDNCSKEAYELAFKFHPDYKKYYKLIDGNYEYSEDE